MPRAYSSGGRVARVAAILNSSSCRPRAALWAFKAILYLAELSEWRLRGCGARPGRIALHSNPVEPTPVCAGVFRKRACPKPWSRNHWCAKAGA